MTNEFSQLSLHDDIIETLTELGYTSPTPIQAAVIPTMLTGVDVIGQAQTGTGKTAAFSLPIVQNLEPDQRYVQALVMAPTRELAIQTATSMYNYGKGRKTRVMAIYGGQSYDKQIRRLKKGVDIVVGTPGRLLDLIKQNYLDLSQVRAVVLDEADEMLSMGFAEDIESIFDQTSDERQTALFSATFPPAIRRLADKYMVEPQSFVIEKKELTVSSVAQRYYLVRDSDKVGAMARLFELEDLNSAIVFTRTRISTGEVANELTVRGFPAEALNGDLSQEARDKVLGRFRKGQIRVLVATDVAARGLDIDDISHVFNFDLPLEPELYVHRIGRTGRAGRTGVAISLVTPKEGRLLRNIEHYSKHTIERASLPTVDDIMQKREGKLRSQIEIWLKRGRCRQEIELAAELVEEGYSPLEVAAVALKLARSEDKQRPIEPIKENVTWTLDKRGKRGNDRNDRRGDRNRDRPRATSGSYRRDRRNSDTSHEEGMVRLLMDIGRSQGTRPSNVVGVLANFASVPGSEIGRIRINDTDTYVDVPEVYVKQILSKSGKYQISGQKVSVKLMRGGKGG